MTRFRWSIGCAVVLLALALVGGPADAGTQWKPSRPITVIVPWPAGGASDTTARMIAAQMEAPLGQRLVIVNTAGGGGAIGTKETWERPHDGQTLTGNANTSIVSYAVLGQLDITHRDWQYYYPMYTPNIIAVKKDSPLKSLEDLIAAMKARPGAVTVASAGVGSSGHLGAEVLRFATGTTYRHVPYAGGAPAVLAVASGESEVVMQLSIEVAEMLRGGRLRALAVMTKQPMEIDGYGKIPGISLPNFEDFGSYFGLMAPKDLPAEVSASLEAAFKQAAATETVRSYAKQKGGVSVTVSGKDAYDLTERFARRVAWLLHDGGLAKRSPQELNIPKP
jgi:tripartite-type tricarboxylate transporter receptor subunit TctC